MSEETTEAATVDETKAVAPAPDVPPVVVRRQSLATRMGVCDMRVGVGATAQLGEALRGVVGKPRRVLVAHSADVPADVVSVELLELPQPVRPKPATANADMPAMPMKRRRLI